MVNWVKRVETMKNNQLADRESIVAVGFFQPAGMMDAQVSSSVGGLMGALMNGFIKKKQAEKQSPVNSSEMSSAYPKIATVAAVTTSNRLMIYDQSVASGKPKKLLLELKKGDMVVTDLQKGKLKTTVSVKFSDGGELMFDAPKGQDIEGFASAA